MKIEYKGPEKEVVVFGIGVFQRDKAVDIDKSIGQNLINTNPNFKKAGGIK